MGNVCGQVCQDKEVHAIVEIALREMKKEILDCIKSELTQSRTPPSTSELNTQSCENEQNQNKLRSLK